MKLNVLLIAVPLLVYSDSLFRPPPEQQVPSPWFTGPLLAPSAQTVPPGEYDIEPYIYAQAFTGSYNNDWKAVKSPTLWNFSSQTLIEFGILSWFDFELEPTFTYNYNHGAAKWALQDSPAAFNFQLYRSVPVKSTDYATCLKFTVQELFPIGKYRNLNPKKKSTDLGGAGSWETEFTLEWGNFVYLGRRHFLHTVVLVQYTVPTPVHVKGFNAYGGGYGTNGTFHTPQRIGFDVAFETSLTQQWALAMDVAGFWTIGKPRFTGKNPPGNAAVGPPGARTQFSLAPAVEYNWSEHWGVIAGVWFTFAGRNSPQFTSGVFALNYFK